MWDLIIDNPLNSRNTISLPIIILCIAGKSKSVQMSKLMKSGQISWTKMNTNKFVQKRKWILQKCILWNCISKVNLHSVSFKFKMIWLFVDFPLKTKWNIFPFWKYFTLKVWGKDHLKPIRTTTTKIKTKLKKNKKTTKTQTPKNRK